MSYFFDTYIGFPRALDERILFLQYVNKSRAPLLSYIPEGNDRDFDLAYGFLSQAPDIGYLRIASFNLSLSDTEIEKIFLRLQSGRALVIDMRGNGGGDPALAIKFAAYLTDKTVYMGYERFKTGPGAQDFASSQMNLKPADSRALYLRPILILTDRGCYSAASTFITFASALPQVRLMGQRTGGGSGFPGDGFLANGWEWSLTVSEFIDAKGRRLDDGLEPDIPASLNPNDRTKDGILEAAFALLR